MIKVTFFCLIFFLVVMMVVSYMLHEGFAGTVPITPPVTPITPPVAPVNPPQDRSELLKIIQEAVRNELLANRLANPIIQDPPVNTDIISQGNEYNASSHGSHDEDHDEDHDVSCSNTKMRLW